MDYSIENEYLKVTVTTYGAQLKSVIRKCDGVEHMWQADPAVWGFHAPILFPHAGKVVDGVIEAKGQTFQAAQHGFVRLMEHDFVDQTADTIVLEICSSPETLEKFPYEFRLVKQIYLACADRILHNMLGKWGAIYDEINADFESHPYKTCNYFDELPQEFSRKFLEEFLTRKGVRTPLKNVICNWKRKGWIEKLATGNLRKTASRAISSSKKKK